MPPRYDTCHPRAVTEAGGVASKVRNGLPAQSGKGRRSQRRPDPLPVGHSPVRGSHADRKGVTVVRHSSAASPIRPAPTPATEPDLSTGEALARYLTHHERYDVATLERERFQTPVEIERRRRVLEQVPMDSGDEDAPGLLAAS